ncbi:MAG: nitroreductase family deazaflavin-dependent oxidoreductase [Pseudonocardia sp.]|nr:nitroreductase family deazaflavin-dependent oxidoreductase [Pseudonocardia sp.]
MTEVSRIKPPVWIKDMNEGLMEQQRQGTLGFELSVLTVPGRRSGEPRRTPLTVLDHGGSRYVLGGFPAADWIRNVRAAGRGTLTTGDEVEQVRIVEVDPADAGPMLREWPAVTPIGVEMMRDAGVVADVTPDALEAVAGICPVFRLDPA